MPPASHSANLRARREALGATVRQMATGLGIDVTDLLAFEGGAAPDDRLSFYTAWLSRLETSTPGRRIQQFQRAIEGLRFN